MQYVTYSGDTEALLIEVAEVLPEFIHEDMDGDKLIGPLTKIPTYRNGEETISVVKDLPIELRNLENLKILGIIDGTPYDPRVEWVDNESQLIYERVTEVLKPVITDDGEFPKPYLIGIVG